jgi:hypothetical protein
MGISMNSLPLPLSCGPEQFQNIYNDLSLYGSPGHEDIEIEFKHDHFFPKTSPKKNVLFSQRDYKIVQYLLYFFEKNPLCIAKLHSPHAFILKFKPLCKGNSDLKIRFCNLQQEIYGITAIVSTEAITAKILQESDLKIQEKEKMLQQTLTEHQSKLEEIEKKHQQCLAEHQETLGKIEKKLQDVKKDLEEAEDTLLVCKDGFVTCHITFLKKICFFKISYDNSQMAKNSLTDSEAKKYKYKYKFENYTFNTLYTLLDWIKDSQSLKKIESSDALIELYQLADYLNDPDFSKDCLKKCKSKLKDNDLLTLLSVAKYDVSDPLIQHCCDYVICEHRALINHSKMADIQPAYFMEIAKALEYKDSYKLVLSWATAQSKKNHMPVKEILKQKINKQKLVDYLNLRVIAPQDFLEDFLSQKVLSNSDSLTWLEFYLKRFIQENTSEFHVHRIDDLHTSIYWNIPIDILYTAKSPTEDPTLSTIFYLKKTKCDLFIGKEENPIKFLVGVSVYKTGDEFKSIIKVGNSKWPSDKPIEDKMQIWNSETQTNHIVYFSEEEIHKQIDTKKCCLPVKVTIILSNSDPSTKEPKKND